MNKTPAQMFGQIFGAIYALIGIAGFFVTGDAEFAGPNGEPLLGLDVNGLHNVVHLAVGIALLVASRATETAQQVNTAVGVVLLVVGIAGFFVTDSDANLLALNTVDNLIHLATAALALTVGRQVSGNRSATA